jgi:hypothetical protein
MATNIASKAASRARTTNGVLRGRESMIPGGSAESVVVSFAVQEAPAELVAPAGVHVAVAPKFAPPFKNCTVPVGPTAELLLVLTVAVSVTLPPEVIDPMLEVTAVVVVACVMVIDNVLLLACDV